MNIFDNRIMKMCKYFFFKHNELSNFVLSDSVCIIQVISIICSQTLIMSLVKGNRYAWRLPFLQGILPVCSSAHQASSLTHLCRVDSSTISLWTGSFLISLVPGWFLLLPYFKELSELNANNVDPDKTPRSAASDLGLRCLSMPLLWDDRLKWVK